MAKMKKILGLAMAAVLCTASVMPALAEGASETYTDENGVTFTTTTTVTEEGKNTVTVEIKEWNNAAVEDAEVAIEGEQTTVETENKKKESTVVDGEETQTEVIEEKPEEETYPEVEVDLIPGETTTAEGITGVTEIDNLNGKGNANNTDTTTVTEIERTVTAETSDVETKVNELADDMEGLQPELKFDRDSKEDQAAKKKETELYTDNGHFNNPDDFTVTDSPEGYPFKYVGSADYSGHYVSKICVVYERDEAGNPIKDENGEYVIKQLKTGKGVVLTQGGVPTTDLNGPYDQLTGTRPTMFMLMNEGGDTLYGYCIDLGTGTQDDHWYTVANLEDSEYYASEEAEGHVRSIAMNGYWGTAAGEDAANPATGSIEKIREAMKAALKEGKIEAEYDITFAVREQDNGRELQEGEYRYGGFIYKHVTEHVVITDEVIDAMTEGEAMDATQMAIWSYANGSNFNLDGTDRAIVGDVTYGSCALGDSLNGQNDYVGAARTKAFYNWLVNLDPTEAETVVANEKNFVEDMSLVVGDKVEGHANNGDENKDNDAYNTEIKFTLAFVPDPESDDLLVYLTDAEGNAINDAEGNPIVRRLAGKDSEGREAETILPEEDGSYVLSGLQLIENKEFTFDLRLEGTQYLDQGVYIYTAQGGTDASQTMVGVAEGTRTVDISASMTITFDDDENDKVVAERKWHKSTSRNKTTGRTNDPSTTVINDEGVPMAASADGLVEIIDEEVPLAAAPETGDNSIVYVLVSLISLAGAAVLLIKRRTA